MANKCVAKSSDVAELLRYVPDFYSRKDVKSFAPLFTNSDRSVKIISMEIISNITARGFLRVSETSGYDLEAFKRYDISLPECTYVKGFVKSDSRNGQSYYVVAAFDKHGNLIGHGFCDCESSNYYGLPCKHVNKLRNVVKRNMDELKQIFWL